MWRDDETRDGQEIEESCEYLDVHHEYLDVHHETNSKLLYRDAQFDFGVAEELWNRYAGFALGHL
jgi:hypothetical protein